MRYFRVVSITKNTQRYPDSAADTKEFPELVARVQDEQDIFVVDEHRNAWRASEFFHITWPHARRFITMPEP